MKQIKKIIEALGTVVVQWVDRCVEGLTAPRCVPVRVYVRRS